MGILFALGFLILSVYCAIRFSTAAGNWLTGGRYRAYRQLAQNYRGRYENRGFNDPPTVSFSHNGSSVRVGLAPQVPGQTNRPRTRVVARFHQGLPFRMELAPVMRPAPPQPPKGTRLVRVGDQEFDRGFVAQANDVEMARAFLTPAVRWSLFNIQRLAPPGGMLLSINPERLLLQVDRNLAQNSASLIQAVHETLLIHDGLQTGVASRLSVGISILSDGRDDSDADVATICQVCGEPVSEPLVLCLRCKTPHHQDCWEFVGSCAIYGCGGKNSEPPGCNPG